MPSPSKLVTRAIRRAWPMTVTLPDLGGGFAVQPLSAPVRSDTATSGRFTVAPGVYLLSGAGPVDPATLPKQVGVLGLAEYHPPPADTLPLSVESLAPPELLADRANEVVARVADAAPPDSVLLFVQPAAGGWFQRFWMRPLDGYRYGATIPAGALREGPSEFVVTVYRGGAPLTFPGALTRRSWDWDWSTRETWKLDVVGPRTPLTLFAPRGDAARLTFTRIGDAGRRGLFRLGVSELTGAPLFHLELPVDQSGWSPPDYTASLVIAERIAARKQSISGAQTLSLRLRGLGARQVLHVTLMEDDGTSWTAAVPVDSSWQETSVPLRSFSAGRGVMLPQGFPGEWSYWVGPAEGRGGPGDHPRLEHLERLQLSLRKEPGVAAAAGSYGVEVESVRLSFAAEAPAPRAP
jgi:hypothetical protein